MIDIFNIGVMEIVEKYDLLNIYKNYGWKDFIEVLHPIPENKIKKFYKKLGEKYSA